MQGPLSTYMLLLPELLVGGGALLFLMIGVYAGEKRLRLIIKSAALLLLAVLVSIVYAWGQQGTVFGGMLIFDSFSVVVKGILVFSAGMVLLLLHGHLGRSKWLTAEIVPLMLLALLGMMLMVSAHHLLALYMAIELMSLSLYILASMNRDSVLSSEAGLKYFVLGALASGLFLFGSAYVFGFSGTVDYSGMAVAYGGMKVLPIGILLGVILILIGLFFKVSAVPFHMWTPDVYQGAPTLVTAFFAAAPKVAGMAVIARFVMQPLLSVIVQWQQIVVVVAIASMLLGALAALRQTNIKRLIAYSSIGHVGYMLVGIASANITGIQSILMYGVLYVMMTIGLFCAVLQPRRNGEAAESLNDYKGLAKSEPLLAAIISIFMLSMAGIPPLAGFFAKFYVFLAAIEEELYPLAVIGVLSSVVGAFYYLRVIKLMYFDEADAPLDVINRYTTAHKLVLTVTTLFTLLFFLYPTPLTILTRVAARSLLN